MNKWIQFFKEALDENLINEELVDFWTSGVKAEERRLESIRTRLRIITMILLLLCIAVIVSKYI